MSARRAWLLVCLGFGCASSPSARPESSEPETQIERDDLAMEAEDDEEAAYEGAYYQAAEAEDDSEATSEP